MTPQEFKERYLEGLSNGFKEAPEEVRTRLVEQLSQFTIYPPELLHRSSLSEKDMMFLGLTGLPQSAAPSLNFKNIYESIPDLETHPFFKDYFVIGNAGQTRLLAIDKEAGDVACVDLAEKETLFVNNSLEQFAECICLFQEYRDRNDLNAGFQKMAEIDPQLTEYYSFWQDETENFIDNVVDLLNEAARKKNQ
jgi:hypothetical protein